MPANETGQQQRYDVSCVCVCINNVQAVNLNINIARLKSAVCKVGTCAYALQGTFCRCSYLPCWSRGAQSTRSSYSRLCIITGLLLAAQVMCSSNNPHTSDTHTCTHTHTHTHAHTCTHKCTCAHAHTRMHPCTYTHTNYTHTHTQASSGVPAALHRPYPAYQRLLHPSD
jgi:ABC-type nickel/cobalt efflux system permease component RcnA